MEGRPDGGPLFHAETAWATEVKRRVAEVGVGAVDLWMGRGPPPTHRPAKMPRSRLTF
jgi:hypothetical protein